ncbi:MAG: ABC transporter ATP-binding protein [Nocardioides sp.]
MNATALRLEGVTVETVDGRPIIAGVGLSLGRGQILGLVGESGSGKTTTALALFGFTQPGVVLTSGTLEVTGHPTFDLRDATAVSKLRGRELAYVPQSPGTALNPSMRIGVALREMQLHGGRGTDRAELDRTRAEVMEIVGLSSSEEFLRRFPHQLSGGQQQRVCIANALLSGARTMVLDEPTTGLDVITQAAVLVELRRLRDETGVSMVYISHDLAVVADLATHVAVMYAGEIVETGTTDQVIHAPAHPYTRGLLESTPDHRSSHSLTAMPGVAISLYERAGDQCSFAPRCPRATAECTSSEPALLPITADEHFVRCYHHIDERRAVQPSVVGDATAEAAPETTVLEVTDLTVEHRVKGRKVAAVDGIGFTVRRGECVAIVGESGSGKTTTARAVVGLQPFEKGTITLHGKRLEPRAAKRTAEQRRQVQIVFQNATSALNPREDVRTAVSRALKICPPDRRRSVEELMDLVRLQPSLASSYPGELSGGERQRVGIARALATDCELLVCDEVTSALDVSVQAAVLNLLADLQQRLGLSMLFITHDLGVVANIADQVLVLQHGVIRETGAARRILDQPQSDYARRLVQAAPVVGHRPEPPHGPPDVDHATTAVATTEGADTR